MITDPKTKKGKRTIAFRPTQWERAMIEERVKASGCIRKILLQEAVSIPILL